MNKNMIKSCFNWAIADGNSDCQISHEIKVDNTIESIHQEKLLNPDACLVLKALEGVDFCEQNVRIHPIYKVFKVALLAECTKIESYTGKTQEYCQTHHGELIYETESKVYRFDIQFKTHDVSEFTLRFIVPRANPFCWYGMHIILEKSNLADSLGSTSVLNKAMIDCSIDESKLSEKAVNLRAFLMASMGRYQHMNIPQQQIKHRENICNNNTMQKPSSSRNSDETSDLSSSSYSTFEDCLRTKYEESKYPQAPAGQPPLASASFSEVIAKQYIDSKFVQLEDTIDAKLQALEIRQNQKLDKILSLLELMGKT